VVAASGSGVSYSWANGWGSNDSIFIDVADTYQVTSTGSNGCTNSMSVTIEEDRFEPDSLFTYTPQIIMDDQAILDLNGPSINGIVYRWYMNDSLVVESDDITLQLPTFEAGQFEVCMEAFYTSLCQSSHCEMVEVHESLQCYVPNTFTPDQDNLNDGFKPSFSNIELLERYEMVVMNRWGEIIFKSSNPTKSWDGRYLEGEYYVPDGEYVYRIIYKEFSAIDVKELTGYIRILR
jgi:gliding motility-associated-like protein